MEHARDVSEIQGLLDQFVQRYEAMDADGVVELFAEEDAVVVGTGADEVRFGLGEIRAQVERDISQADDISLLMESPRINVAGGAAFAYADANFVGTVGGESLQMPVRLTLGLVHDEHGWRIIQWHGSVAYGAQAEGESFPS